MKQERQVGAPVCYRHPDRETYVQCTRCGRPICPDCMREAAVGFHCPECVAEGRRGTRVARTAFGGSQAGVHGYVTYALIGLNAAVALLTLLIAGASGGGMFGGITPLHVEGAIVGLAGGADGAPTGVATGEYWRLFTSMFLHFGILHLLVNMWALWLLGRYLERALGPLRYLALYLVSGLGGGVAVYLLTAPNQFTAGASGAIFGLFAALFVVNRKLGLDNSGVAILILINLSLGFFVPNISLTGHIGGLVTGGVLAFGIAYAPKKHRTLVQVATVAAVLVVLVIVTITRTEMLISGSTSTAVAALRG